MHYLQFLPRTTYEEWGVQTILILGIIGLGSTVIYLYKSKDKAIRKKEESFAIIIKDKDAQIMAVIKEHQDDLKAENQTMKEVMDKYNQFTQSIKEMVLNKR
jgi:hypothetical protein